jgi:hypothetical protein
MEHESQTWLLVYFITAAAVFFFQDKGFLFV